MARGRTVRCLFSFEKMHLIPRGLWLSYCDKAVGETSPFSSITCYKKKTDVFCGACLTLNDTCIEFVAALAAKIN
jgi:hypothetical protein